MKIRTVVGTLLVMAIVVSSGAFGQPTTDWDHVKSIWTTLTPAEQGAYMEMLANEPDSPIRGNVTALGEDVGPMVRIPADTCGGTTNEVGAFPYSDSGDNSALVNDYDLELSATCNTGFNSSGTEIVYRVRVDQTCDVNVDESQGTYDVVLWAVTNCGDPDNTCVGSSDAGNPESFGFTANAGTDYFLMVDGWNGQGGAYTVNITETTTVGCSLVPVELQTFTVE